MKTRLDPRHLKRIQTVQQLFTLSFRKSDSIPDQTKEVEEIRSRLSEIDDRLQKAAPAYPIDKIAKIDAAILRYSVYELLYKKDAPPKVIVDEAIEVAKEFGADSSASFINGVLGTILQSLT
jgi:N utilization substance protein B